MRAEGPNERPTIIRIYSSSKTMLSAEPAPKSCPNMGKAADIYVVHVICGLVLHSMNPRFFNLSLRICCKFAHFLISTIAKENLN